MKFEIELQYADFHPDQVEKIGFADEEQAIKIVHSFPWEREFEKMDYRENDETSSTVPSVAIRNNQNELLIISAVNQENFIVEFQTPTQIGELMVTLNQFQNRSGLTVESIIQRFYSGSAKDIFSLRLFEKEGHEEKEVYTMREWPLFSLAFGAGMVLLILSFVLFTYGFTSRALPGLLFIGVIIGGTGMSAVIILQHIVTDWNKEVSFFPEGLVIKQKGTEVRIHRKDIAQLAIVANEEHRTLRSYQYARIKTKDERAYIVTSLLIEPLELVNKLKVNHKMESVFYPFIRLDTLSQKEKDEIKNNHEKKRNEFLETYKSFEDSKLYQIANDKSYADYAVAAAKEILEQRRKK